jgi:tetratricopeptide (TPR) repeat protein
VAIAPTKPSPPDDDGATLEKARTAYADGNQHLFAGDLAGAIDAYQQALAIEPTFFAGYRGLGLAYAQQHEVAKALQAFRKYVGSAPTAKDVPLIKQRIVALQPSSPGRPRRASR